MKRKPFVVIAAIVLGLVTGVASAHKPSDSYLNIRSGADGLEAQWDIALRDLEFAIGLDGDGDGSITWGEIRGRRDAIQTYALERLTVRAKGAECRPVPTALLVDDHTDGAYAVLRFRLACGPDESHRELEIGYRLFSDLDPTHRGLLRIDHPAGAVSAVLGPDNPVRRFTLGETSRIEQFADFVREGVWHIWIGFDHVLFLVSLLLPAVLARRGTHWTGVISFGPAFWDVFRIVTSFTIAHSITLSLAALSIVQLPSRLVESAIALSVVLAALNNVVPLVERGRWIVAFAFGLVHGFGFASVLADLGLPEGALLLALFGFNIGVEAGQLSIVLFFLPLAFLVRRSWFYRRLVMVGGSAAVALVAALWFLERALDVKML